MNINKHIVVATLGLVAVGALKKYAEKESFTPVFVGGFVFMLAMSVLDLFGGQASKLASSLAMIGFVGTALTELSPDFLKKLQNPPSGGSSSGPVHSCPNSGKPGFSITPCAPCHYHDSTTKGCVPCANCTPA